MNLWETKTPTGWQRCPNCSGTGRQFEPNLLFGAPCSVCNGRKIISIATGRPPPKELTPR